MDDYDVHVVEEELSDPLAAVVTKGCPFLSALNLFVSVSTVVLTVKLQKPSMRHQKIPVSLFGIDLLVRGPMPAAKLKRPLIRFQRPLE
jgi:hypothetical protein